MSFVLYKSEDWSRKYYTEQEQHCKTLPLYLFCHCVKNIHKDDCRLTIKVYMYQEKMKKLLSINKPQNEASLLTSCELKFTVCISNFTAQSGVFWYSFTNNLIVYLSQNRWWWFEHWDWRFSLTHWTSIKRHNGKYNWKAVRHSLKYTQPEFKHTVSNKYSGIV